MDALFQWWPIMWAARALFLLALAVALVLVLALLGRVLRPSTWLPLILGNLPELRGVRSTVRVLGQEFEANAEMDSKRDDQLFALEDRIRELEELTDVQGAALEELLETKGGDP